MSSHGRSARGGNSVNFAAAAAAEPDYDYMRRSNHHQQENELGLTKEEEKKCERAFTAFDKDGNGDIDVDELRIVLKMMGIKVTEAKLQRMMNDANAEDPTNIKLDQFKRVIGK